VSNEAQQLLAILEAPLAYIQPLDASPRELFRVEGRVPGLDEQRAEDDFEHVGPGERLLRGLQGGRRGRRGHGGYIGGHWAGDDDARRGAQSLWGCELRAWTELLAWGLARREGTCVDRGLGRVGLDTWVASKTKSTSPRNAIIVVGPRLHFPAHMSSLGISQHEEKSMPLGLLEARFVVQRSLVRD
jgi:hypothetical protein